MTIQNREPGRWWKVLLVALWCLPALAQVPSSAPAPANPPAQNTAAQPKDPLRRQTPQSSVLNFIKYAHRHEYATAAKYLELTTKKQKAQGEELARELHILLNTSFRGSIGSISDLPEGNDEDTLDPNLEVVGRFVLQDNDVKVRMVRVFQNDTGPIWLFSQETLEQVPDLFEQAGSSALDRYLPTYLIDNLFLGISAGRWLAWILSIPFAWLVAWSVVRLPQRLWRRGWKLPPATLRRDSIAQPLALVVGILVHAGLIWIIGMPLYYRVPYFRFLMVLLTFCVAWLLARVADRMYERAGLHPLRRESQSLLQLVHRLVELSLFIVAVLVVFTLLGFNTRTMLAGLGIGGVALALAAQKTLENLFGGVTLVMDNAISVGDDCMISNRQITVREIGLRSIRGTTLEGTEMSFPNGLLTQSNIENLSRRSRCLISATLMVSLETTLAQLHCMIAEVRELLYSHARVQQETARFRLAGLGHLGYQIELFAFINSVDLAEFTAIREDLLFRIVRIADSNGVAWAVPRQISYSAQKPAANEQKIEDAEEVVKKWDDESESPFPDFSPRHIAELRGTVAYPPERSVLRENQAPLKKDASGAV